MVIFKYIFQNVYIFFNTNSWNIFNYTLMSLKDILPHWSNRSWHMSLILFKYKQLPSLCFLPKLRSIIVYIYRNNMSLRTWFQKQQKDPHKPIKVYRKKLEYGERDKHVGHASRIHKKSTNFAAQFNFINFFLIYPKNNNIYTNMIPGVGSVGSYKLIWHV